MYNEIIELIEKHRIKEAFVQLEALTREPEYQEISTDLHQCKVIYMYMLQYIASGANDPEREMLYMDIQRRCNSLVSQIAFIQKTSKSYMRQRLTDIQTRRALTLPQRLELVNNSRKWKLLMTIDNKQHSEDPKNEQMAELSIMRYTDEAFYQTWASPSWSKNDYRSALDIMLSGCFPINTLAVIISAVTLNQTYLFDANKLRFLLQVYANCNNKEIAWRALTGIALTVYFNEDKLHFYPDIVKQLDELSASKETRNRLNTLQSILLYSRETEGINREMEEQIMPSILKKDKEWINKGKKIIEMEDIEEAIAANPEWSKDIENMQEQLMAIKKLEEEGADTQMASFAHLKSFTFFNEAAHWFYLFDMNSAFVKRIPDLEKIKKNPFFNLLINMPSFCDSDKYSLLFALNSMPEMHKTVADLPEGIIDMNANILPQKADDIAMARFYIFDLYRFFKLWRFRSEQKDIFAQPLALWKCKTLAKMFATPEVLLGIADHLTHFNHINEASEVYGLLCKEQNDQASLWEKYGYTLQLQKMYAEALVAYTKADLIKPNSEWTIKQKMQCHRHLKQYKETLECLSFLLNKEPDNLKLCQLAGQCYVKTGQYDKALPYFFKIEYLDKSPNNARRAIAWCHFMTDQYDEAMKYYEMLLKSDCATASDWLNMGHIYLVKNDIQKALEYYKKSEGNGTHEDFVTMYFADQDTLQSKGVDNILICVVPDMI